MEPEVQEDMTPQPVLFLVPKTETEPIPFSGFKKPNTTPVPDEFFDLVAPRLNEAELRVALYIIRRTYGWKKNEDAISLQQLTKGIRTKEGKIIDHGTGLSKSSVTRALRGLEAKNVIAVTRNHDAIKGDRPTTYGLLFEQHPCPAGGTPPVPLEGHPLSRWRDTQQTVRQETVDNNTPLPPEGDESSPPDIGNGEPEPGATETQGRPENPPPTPSQLRPMSEADLDVAFDHIMGDGRKIDRRSRVNLIKTMKDNGWAEYPERMRQLRSDIRSLWEEKNQNRIDESQLDLLMERVEPGEYSEVLAKAKEYVRSVPKDEPKWLRHLKNWLPTWRESKIDTYEPSTKITPPLPSEHIALMTGMTGMNMNRKAK